MGPISETETAFYGLTSLQLLKISQCEELTCLPKGLLQPTLVELILDSSPKLTTPNADELGSLTSLKTLLISGCPKLGSSWEGLGCTTNLQTMVIGEFGKEFGYFPWPASPHSKLFEECWPRHLVIKEKSVASPPWGHFTSLECLGLMGWPEVKSLPYQLEHLTALTHLDISNFSGLESLPERLCKLPTLESLRIFNCPLLKKRYEKGSGKGWHKIAHIPSIEITDTEEELLASL